MTTEPRWDAGGALAPVDGTVDLWSASLDLPTPLVCRLAGCLSPDEQVRADRFVSPRDRDRFVAARAFLRALLARHVGAAPGDLRFRYGSHGKPALVDLRHDLRFNLAHSGALAVCAVTHGHEVGADVERVKPIKDADAVARAAFSPWELTRLASLPQPLRLRAFYEAWTRKEAFLKALGCGLDRPLDSFDVAFGPGESPRLLRSQRDPAEPARFSLHAFEPEADYVGAVAIAGRVGQMRQRRWHWA